ncbi:aminotransferase class I/II-fold pyridoxal phosphate-dependent enzyme [Alkalibacter saccharofermentans]|uniref:Lysine decarboxylase n=1 Tax=Alkalibacter saccharofermentans DSM 14828 TaxID=1120975 RepID=A0A1M4T9I0_9FIRM|nr:aminotransferase class I/II-fold pyridoxal phosphate-dependent enzyme [Alkalibacter saccharofermentans]SHE41159.1 lysine decarboxylase [Alkalibacter saccharofermentans DSM 14828]
MKSRLYLNIESKRKNANFHMPGHKSRDFTKLGWEYFDTTELEGTDNLNNPQKEIREIERQISKSYASKECIISVNGSTSLIMAGIMGSCREGDCVAVARNSHKSVFSAIYYGRLKTLFIDPVLDPIYGYPVGIDLKHLEAELRKTRVRALVMTYPTYYGTCDDLNAVKHICDSHDVLLIVDEAHGAHFKHSMEFPPSSIDIGADITIHSTHKILSSLNQGAVLHVKSDRVDMENIRRHMAMLQTSSPSYPIILSVEEAVKFMNENGEKKLEKIQGFYERVKKALEGTKFTLIHDKISREILQVDKAKIWLAPGGVGKILAEDYNIDIELDDGKTALCMMGVGTVIEDVDRLITALKDISEKGLFKDSLEDSKRALFPKAGNKVMEAWEIDRMKKRMVSIKKAAGKVSASYLVPYPPGVPVVCPGEMVSDAAADYLYSMKEGSVDGMIEDKMIYILDEEQTL